MDLDVAAAVKGHSLLESLDCTYYVAILCDATSAFCLDTSSSSELNSVILHCAQQMCSLGKHMIMAACCTTARDGLYENMHESKKLHVRLLQIRNPHGHGEWTGDWSDQSSKWTTTKIREFGL